MKKARFSLLLLLIAAATLKLEGMSTESRLTVSGQALKLEFDPLNLEKNQILEIIIN